MTPMTWRFTPRKVAYLYVLGLLTGFGIAGMLFALSPLFTGRFPWGAAFGTLTFVTVTARVVLACRTRISEPPVPTMK